MAKLLATLLPLLCIAGSRNTILDYSGVPKPMVDLGPRTIRIAGLTMVGIMCCCCSRSPDDVGSAILMLVLLLQPLAVAKASTR